MSKATIKAAILAMALMASGAYAADEARKMHGRHMHGAMHEGKSMDGAMDHGAMAHDGKQMFLVKRTVDGYQLSFHVMRAPEGMAANGSHHFMIKIERDGKPADVLAVNSKVIHPDGSEEQKMMKKMGDWFMAPYDLGHSGRHQLLVLFKTADGKKHFAGVWYPDKP